MIESANAREKDKLSSTCSGCTIGSIGSGSWKNTMHKINIGTSGQWAVAGDRGSELKQKFVDARRHVDMGHGHVACFAAAPSSQSQQSPAPAKAKGSFF